MKEVLDAVSKICGSDSFEKIPAFHARLEQELQRPVAIFAAVPSENGNEHMFDVDFDFNHRNVKILNSPTELVSDASKCVVLGVVTSPDSGQPSTLCCRLLDEQPIGAVVHNCTAVSPGKNLIGPVVTSFSFAECFAAGALAKPAIALSDRGMLQVPLGDVPEDVLRAWAGVKEIENDEEEPRFCIEDPMKYFFKSTIEQADGSTVEVVASAHDFHCMSHLLNLFNPSENSEVKPITKPIVFCPANKIARRSMALFHALASQRVLEAERNGIDLPW